MQGSIAAMLYFIIMENVLCAPENVNACSATFNNNIMKDIKSDLQLLIILVIQIADPLLEKAAAKKKFC